MAKMTVARANRWQKHIDKMLKEARALEADLGSAKLTTSGSTYAAVNEIGKQLAEVPDLLVNGLVVLADLQGDLDQAAQARRDAAAAKKAAAS